MMNHPVESRLNDYLDGELDARDEAELRAHLAECASCRVELDRLSAVLDAAAHMSDSIEPRRDLWSAIDARIDSAGSADLDAWRSRKRGALWSHRYELAAAAAVLVLFASAGTFFLVRDEGAAPIAAFEQTPAPGTTSAVQLVSVPGQADYAEAIRELDTLLREREGQLDPQTAEVVRRNMAIIDQAIRDAQHALAADPANGDLNRAVSAAYKTKIDLLRRAVELPART
jgi:hypothetical protein